MIVFIGNMIMAGSLSSSDSATNLYNPIVVEKICYSHPTFPFHRIAVDNITNLSFNPLTTSVSATSNPREV